ncbi:MAG: AAA family ATPase, partial [Thermoprotei archaeon]
KMPLAPDVNLQEIAELTEGYSGSDLEVLVREAGLAALRENINADKVSRKHFEQAMQKIKPSITMEMVKYYENWSERSRKIMQLQRATVGFYV